MSNDGKVIDVAAFQLFSRQISLNGFGAEGQLRLLSASVLVIGAGGLGCPVLQSLAAMGIGKFGIVDGDRVEVSNLHRQMLFSRVVIGQYKADAAKEAIQCLGHGPEVAVWTQFLDRSLAENIFSDYDIVIDATDNFDSKYLIDSAARNAGVPVCYASVNKFEGQVALFGAGDGWASYIDAFPKRTPENFTSSCSDSGVLGVVPALIGSYQALFATLYLAGQHEHLKNKLFFLNAAAPFLRSVSIEKRESVEDVAVDDAPISMVCESPSEIEVISLAAGADDAMIIDVREECELSLKFKNSNHLAKSCFDEWANELDKHSHYIIVCQSGKRSIALVSELRRQGYGSVYSYFGGMNRALNTELPDTMEIFLN